MKKMRAIFLDYQSATPLLPEARAAMEPLWSDGFGNVSSLHRLGLEAREMIDHARAQIAAFIGADDPEEVYFTSTGTESCNWAIKGVAWANQRRGNHIIISATEHFAVLQSADWLARQGFSVTKIPVDAEGIVSPEDVRRAMTDKTILISIHQVNHELGTIEPLAEIGRIAAEYGIAFHTDAVAGAGWVPVRVRELGVSLLSLAPHRFYGPNGVGVLWCDRHTKFSPLIHGGFQEGGWRAGTENVPAIVGAGVAAEIAARELTRRTSHVARLQKKLAEGIFGRIQYLRLNGPPMGPHHAPHLLNLSIEFVEGEAMVLSLDMKGIAVASGSACVSKAQKISHVLTAIGCPPDLAQGSVLFSFGQDNADADIKEVLDTFPGIVTRLRGMSATWAEFQRGEIVPKTGTATGEPVGVEKSAGE